MFSSTEKTSTTTIQHKKILKENIHIHLWKCSSFQANTEIHIFSENEHSSDFQISLQKNMHLRFLLGFLCRANGAEKISFYFNPRNIFTFSCDIKFVYESLARPATVQFSPFSYPWTNFYDVYKAYSVFTFTSLCATELTIEPFIIL